MKKLTKRKGFNFLRSYFDVLNELENDKDKLDFLMSIINKQFLNEDPEDLNFIVNLCYESQRHQIESSVKGWERASNEPLVSASTTTPPSTPPTPKQEEEVQGEEKEEVEYTKPKRNSYDFDYDKFLKFINDTLGRKLRVIKETDKNAIRKRLKEGYTKTNFEYAVRNCKNVKHHKESDYRHCTVEFFTRTKTLDQYGDKLQDFRTHKEYHQVD